MPCFSVIAIPVGQGLFSLHRAQPIQRSQLEINWPSFQAAFMQGRFAAATGTHITWQLVNDCVVKATSFLCCLADFMPLECGSVITVRVCARAEKHKAGGKNTCSVCCSCFLTGCWLKAMQYRIVIHGL